MARNDDKSSIGMVRDPEFARSVLYGMCYIVNNWLKYKLPNGEKDLKNTVMFAIMKTNVGKAFKKHYGIPLDLVGCDDEVKLNPDYSEYTSLTSKYWYGSNENNNPDVCVMASPYSIYFNTVDSFLSEPLRLEPVSIES